MKLYLAIINCTRGCHETRQSIGTHNTFHGALSPQVNDLFNDTAM